METELTSLEMNRLEKVERLRAKGIEPYPTRASRTHTSLDAIHLFESAARSVEIDGVKVETGQVIALLDDRLVASAGSVEEGCLALLEKSQAGEHELITLFYGESITHVDANRIADVIRKKYSNLDVEIQEGGQPHYQFIISVE